MGQRILANRSMIGRYDQTVMATMGLAGMIGAVGSYLLSLKLFPLVFFLAAGVASLVPIAVAYAILTMRRRLRTRPSWGRTLWVILSALIGYPICVSVFQRLCTILDGWFPALPGDLRVFFAMGAAGLLAATLAWGATCIFTACLDIRLLYLFAGAGAVTAVAGSLASGFAARYLAAGPAFLFFLLYPGVLYLVGMGLFGAVFGYALSTYSCAETQQQRTKGTVPGA